MIVDIILADTMADGERLAAAHNMRAVTYIVVVPGTVCANLKKSFSGRNLYCAGTPSFAVEDFQSVLECFGTGAFTLELCPDADNEDGAMDPYDISGCFHAGSLE